MSIVPEFHSREAVAELLYRLIQNRGVSITTLAQQSGVHETTIRQYLNQNCDVDLDSLRPICHALNISVMRFLLAADRIKL